MIPNLRVYRVPASPLRRLLAFTLDLFVIFFSFLAPLQSILIAFLPAKEASFSETMQAIEHLLIGHYGTFVAGIFFLMGILTIAYFALLEWQVGTTLGKILFSLHVEAQAQRPTLWQCIIRSLFVIPTFPFALLWVVDPLMMLFYDNRRLSEILSQTQTVQYVLMRYENGMYGD